MLVLNQFKSLIHMLHAAEGENGEKIRATIWRSIIKAMFYDDSSTQGMFVLMSMNLCD
jgi:hypothetical protein